MYRLAALAFLLPISGCLAGQLREPAGDHYLQTRTIVERCEGAYYDGQCSPDLVEDLEAMCDQAEAIQAITRGSDPGTCREPGER